MKPYNRKALTILSVLLCFSLAALFLNTGAASAALQGLTPAAFQPGFEKTSRVQPVFYLADPHTSNFRIPPPPEALALPPTYLKTATFEVSYLPAGSINQAGDTCGGPPPEGQAAFDYAVNVWSALIKPNVPVRAEVCWTSLDPRYLGYSSPVELMRNFTNAPKTDIWYPVSLANTLAGVDLSPNNSDITIAFNASQNWYMGIDGKTPEGFYDFATAAMHEIGHGLGMSGSMQVAGMDGGYGASDPLLPVIYDLFASTADGKKLTDKNYFANPSYALVQALTTDALYFSGPNANAANGGAPVKLYAPGGWSASSFVHLDMIYHYTANSLMTWVLGKAEAVHDPGPFAIGIMKDLGWPAGYTPPTPTTTTTVTATLTGTVVPGSSTPIPVYNIPPAPASGSSGGERLVLSIAIRLTTFPTPPPPGTPGIHGRVLQNGSPAAGVALKLYLYQTASQTSTYLRSIKTGADGAYLFADVPSLGTGQYYYVFFENRSPVTNPNQVYYWHTPYLPNFVTGEDFQYADFDIQGLSLTYPADQASTSLPVTFTWQGRVGVPNDSFEFYLFNPAAPSAAPTTSLGHTFTHLVEFPLPSPFTFNTPYDWFIMVRSPDLGWGPSAYANQVTFIH